MRRPLNMQKHKKIGLFMLFFMFIFVLTLGCADKTVKESKVKKVNEKVTTQVEIKKAQFGTGLYRDNKVIDNAMIFYEDTPQICLSIELWKVKKETQVQVGLAYQGKTAFMHGEPQMINADKRLGYKFIRPTKGWVKGKYAVSVFVDQQKLFVKNFEIE
jgi:hypothetical protein